jgi:hypothetical protein
MKADCGTELSDLSGSELLALLPGPLALDARTHRGHRGHRGHLAAVPPVC